MSIKNQPLAAPVVHSSPVLLTGASLRRAIGIRDLTDPHAGAHAMQSLVGAAIDALTALWDCEARVVRGSIVVAVADNYDRLGYPPDAIARDERYSRYVCEGAMLRSHTSASIPAALRALAREAEPPRDVLLAVPGITYRRDAIDRLHSGEPHQLDLWRLSRGAPLDRAALRAMIDAVVTRLLPGRRVALADAAHPYTREGLEIHVESEDGAIEIGECGLASPDVLAGAGLAPDRWSGLAMGLGLDRLLMLRKGVPDIRLLRFEDPRIAAQMLDLAPYREVSRQPPVRRDLSIAVEPGTSVEELGDRVRAALGDDAVLVESVTIESRTPARELSEVARARIGLSLEQENVLLRVVLRAVDRTLTHPECNVLRDAIRAAVHRGSM